MAIITVSRGTKSGGEAVARCLATRLGYPCVAQEVLQDAADALAITEARLRQQLTTPPGPLEVASRQRHLYVAALKAALAERCLAGDLVYHGLNGQFLLRHLPGVLRVRLVAPLALRVQAVLRNHEHTTHEAAERYVQKVDRDRRRWVRFMYGADVTDTSLYELTVNLETITLETACVMIAELAGHPPYAMTDEGRARIAAFAAAARRERDRLARGPL